MDKSSLKEDLEKFGRKLTLKWHYYDNNRMFDSNPFKPKSKFNPPKRVSQEERKALYGLRNDASIIIKVGDKGSEVVIWDKEDYLNEAEEQLSYKKIYEKLTDDPSYFIDAMHRALVANVRENSKKIIEH